MPRKQKRKGDSASLKTSIETKCGPPVELQDTQIRTSRKRKLSVIDDLNDMCKSVPVSIKKKRKQKHEKSPHNKAENNKDSSVIQKVEIVNADNEEPEESDASTSIYTVSSSESENAIRKSTRRSLTVKLFDILHNTDVSPINPTKNKKSSSKVKKSYDIKNGFLGFGKNENHVAKQHLEECVEQLKIIEENKKNIFSKVVQSTSATQECSFNNKHDEKEILKKINPSIIFSELESEDLIDMNVWKQKQPERKNNFLKSMKKKDSIVKTNSLDTSVSELNTSAETESSIGEESNRCTVSSTDLNGHRLVDSNLCKIKTDIDEAHSLQQDHSFVNTLDTNTSAAYTIDKEGTEETDDNSHHQNQCNSENTDSVRMNTELKDKHTVPSESVAPIYETVEKTSNVKAVDLTDLKYEVGRETKAVTNEVNIQISDAVKQSRNADILFQQKQNTNLIDQAENEANHRGVSPKQVSKNNGFQQNTLSGSVKRNLRVLLHRVETSHFKDLITMEHTFHQDDNDNDKLKPEVDNTSCGLFSVWLKNESEIAKCADEVNISEEFTSPKKVNSLNNVQTSHENDILFEMRKQENNLDSNLLLENLELMEANSIQKHSATKAKPFDKSAFNENNISQEKMYVRPMEVETLCNELEENIENNSSRENCDTVLTKQVELKVCTHKESLNNERTMPVLDEYRQLTSSDDQIYKKSSTLEVIKGDDLKFISDSFQDENIYAKDDIKVEINSDQKGKLFDNEIVETDGTKVVSTDIISQTEKFVEDSTLISSILLGADTLCSENANVIQDKPIVENYNIVSTEQMELEDSTNIDSKPEAAINTLCSENGNVIQDKPIVENYNIVSTEQMELEDSTYVDSKPEAAIKNNVSLVNLEEDSQFSTCKNQISGKYVTEVMKDNCHHKLISDCTQGEAVNAIADDFQVEIKSDQEDKVFDNGGIKKTNEANFMTVLFNEIKDVLQKKRSIDYPVLSSDMEPETLCSENENVIKERQMVNDNTGSGKQIEFEKCVNMDLKHGTFVEDKISTVNLDGRLLATTTENRFIADDDYENGIIENNQKEESGDNDNIKKAGNTKIVCKIPLENIKKMFNIQTAEPLCIKVCKTPQTKSPRSEEANSCRNENIPMDSKTINNEVGRINAHDSISTPNKTGNTKSVHCQTTSDLHLALLEKEFPDLFKHIKNLDDLKVEKTVVNPPNLSTVKTPNELIMNRENSFTAVSSITASEQRLLDHKFDRSRFSDDSFFGLAVDKDDGHISVDTDIRQIETSTPLQESNVFEKIDQPVDLDINSGCVEFNELIKHGNDILAFDVDSTNRTPKNSTNAQEELINVFENQKCSSDRLELHSDNKENKNTCSDLDKLETKSMDTVTPEKNLINDSDDKNDIVAGTPTALSKKSIDDSIENLQQLTFSGSSITSRHTSTPLICNKRSIGPKLKAASPVNERLAEFPPVQCVTASGLSDEEVSNVKIFCRLFSCRYSNGMLDNTTHLIVKTDERNMTNRTLKYLQAVVQSCCIVSYTWLFECMRQNMLIKPDDYIPLDFSGEKGPSKAYDVMRGVVPNPLDWISSYCILFIEPLLSGCTILDWQKMIKKLNGVTISSFEEFILFPNHHHMIIVSEIDDAPTLSENDVANWLRTYHAVTVDFIWILEVIGRNRLVPFVDYETLAVPEDVLLHFKFPRSMLTSE